MFSWLKGLALDLLYWSSSAFWGGLYGKALRRFLLLSVGLFLTVGAYWPMKTLKDDIFVLLIGNRYQWIAKLLSVGSMAIAVMLYSRYLAASKRSKVVFFVATASSITGMVMAATISADIARYGFLSKGIHRFIGWVFFVYIETYMSILSAIYWAFVNDLSTEEEAKKGYGLLMGAAQLGALLFLIISNFFAKNTGGAPSNPGAIIAISSAMLMLVGVVARYAEYKYSDPKRLSEPNEKRSKTKFDKVDLFGGLKAVFLRKYVLGIFMLVFVSELFVSIVHHQMMYWIEWYRASFGSGAGLTFTAGIMIQVVSTILAFTGTSVIQRKLGLRGAFLSHGVATMAIALIYVLFPSVWTAIGMMVAARAASFALHSPSKEVLYIPADIEVKHKAKAWIDIFGVRVGKFIGVTMSSAIGMKPVGGFLLIWAIAGMYLVIAKLVTSEHDKLLMEQREVS